MAYEAEWIALNEVYNRLMQIYDSKMTVELLLLDAIKAGRIAMEAIYYTANGSAQSGMMLDIDYWPNSSNIIWNESRVEHKIAKGYTSANGKTHFYLGDFHLVKLRSEDILNEWPEYYGSVDSSSDVVSKLVINPPRKGIGGATGDYNWEEYLIEAAVYMYVDGIPKSQNKLFEHLWDRLGGKDSGPSLTQMKTHLGPLWKRMKAANDS